MTSEMIGRVARALAKRHYEKRFGASDQDHILMNVNGNWQIFSDDARAAIEAMREPTAEMTQAGFEFTGDPCWQEDVGKAWRAMIDTALADPLPVIGRTTE